MGTYFTIEELCRSSTAAAKGIKNEPSEQARGNMENLIDEILDPLRKAWGKPITVTSGYRSPELNRAVGGSRTSHHLRGMAADITTGNKVENRRLFQLAMELGLPYCQLIDEKGFSWIHVSYDPDNAKRQILRL